MQREQAPAGRVQSAWWKPEDPLCPAPLTPALYRLPGRHERARTAGAYTGLAGQPMGDGGGDDARRQRGKHGHVIDSPAPRDG